MSTTTTRPINDTTTAQFLAPETHQRAGGKPLRIGDFRKAVDTLNWNRNDLSGATREEFIRMDVRTRMDKHVSVVEVLALQVPSRFIVDLVHADESVRKARETVERWAGYQAQKEG